jgi:hypothetical protein
MAAKDKAAQQSDSHQPAEVRTAEEQAPKAEIPHDPGHGRWILDPITGERRNNNEE